MKSRYNNLVRLFIISSMISILCACSMKNEVIEQPASNILFHFNKSDFDRMEQFVSRFEDGKRDYILVINPTIEGDYVIYDLDSDGYFVDISIDTSRDSYSANTPDVKYRCKGIAIKDESFNGKQRRVLMANECDGAEKIDQLGLFVLQDLN